MYLETKRHAFPRFYFLSNDDLLEILGQAKDPNSIQSHLRKCFDGLYRLEIAMPSSERRHAEALGMHSADGEAVSFSYPVVVDGPVEVWLTNIEKTMRASLKNQLVECLHSSKKVKKEKWITEWPGQLVISASQINWTASCQRALIEASRGEQHALKDLLKKQLITLKKLTEMTQLPLSPIERKKLIALITIEVHSRDVIDKMYRSSSANPSAFEWLSQLRLYWDKEEEDCVIKQTNAVFRYGYEYLGNSGRLVITPLTDRCYMTLTTALHLNRGGSPQGPAGTGKTETVKDLGKAMGKFVIIQNCSDSLDYKSIGRSFSGLAQTGAWGCFDEFNRIETEVLSVVALQISSILNACARKAKTFNFEGQVIKLDSTVGIFITMNPGYAGRVELPDNLKSLFRPVSMMVPDSSMIAEIMLFAEGFGNTRLLAKKVDTLYKLAIQQLSKQDHYDFGLRALTSALRAAGLRKRADLTIADEAVIYLSMKDMNFPKLTSEDMVLFLGILNDLFPGVDTASTINSELRDAIALSLKGNGYEVLGAMVDKVMQLYETKASRHAVMLVGSAGSGKSVCWRTLQKALHQLHVTNPQKYNQILYYPLNPKALTLGQLYGEAKGQTEWTDGILSSLLRKACADDTRDEKWLIIDGPVDTLWIESMNSVMDDNKVLTLNNGERINLTSSVSLLFEVENLAAASPATVSRCGMVYLDYKDLGWRPFVRSWTQKLAPPAIPIMNRLIEKFVPKVLEFRKSATGGISIPELSLVKSLCTMFQTFAVPSNGCDSNNKDSYPKMVELWFLFSLIWSLGAALSDENRKRFDMLLREIEGQFPSKDTVYEYCVDKGKQSWALWEEKLPSNWRYAPNTPFYRIVVPTIETLRTEFLVRGLANAKIPFLVAGDVGTGKTSLVQSVLTSLDDNQLVVNIGMSAATTSQSVQDMIEAKMEKRTKNLYVPIGGKQMIVFVDDLNMPSRDAYGSQPPLEFLKHVMEYGFTYDRQKQTVKQIGDVVISGAMGPPGGGRNSISQRVLDQFVVVDMTFPSDSSLFSMYSTIINQKFQDFDEGVKPLGEIMAKASIEIYHTVVSQLLPTPSKTHYVFNLRDISKVFQGLLRANKEYYDSKESLTKLWVHESFRIFYDRLTNPADCEWFSRLIDEKLNAHFSIQMRSLFPSRKVSPFGDFLSTGTNQYEEMADADKVKELLQQKLDDYNSEPGFISLDLVLFRDAVEHICRIIRVLQNDGGNLLLAGVGGSGRQSLSRMAAYIVQMSVFQIKITKNYRALEFREDLKVLFRKTGVDDEKTIFLITDQQFTQDSFLEDINSILSSGDAPNLYTNEEISEIVQAVSDRALAVKVANNPAAIYQYFLQRVKINLHTIICMDPYSSAYRQRLRMFPALINCTNILWFSSWPEDGLQEVALRYLDKLDMVPAATRNLIAKAFVAAHTSVIAQSNQMMADIKRKVHITPSNYLELVTGYLELLKEKRMEVETAANKLRNGLSKLVETRDNVQQMSIQLEDVKIQVAQYQKQCEDYLVIIVQQKREADDQAKTVAARSEKLEVEEDAIKVVAQAAEADLALAMPALEGATKALEGLSKKDIQEIKSYAKPPPLVEKVLEAVMILKKCEPTWDEGKKQLNNPLFVRQLVTFDKDNISDKILKKIQQYCEDENFQPEIVGRVSGAAKSLCMWVRAMETYSVVFRQIAPKREKLRVANAALSEKQNTLKEAKGKLAEIRSKLDELTAQYDEKVLLQEKLRQDAETTEIKLIRAEQLVTGLAGERSRWENSIKAYENAMVALPGDCILAAAFLSYAGPFTSKYRGLLYKTWNQQLISLEIPFTADFQPVTFLGKATEIHEWNVQGLPSDMFSAENGIIVKRGRRWPVIIDPQAQANKWIKKLEIKQDLKIVDLKQADYMRVLENAIRFGSPALLQGVGEKLDATLDPILNKSIIRKDGRMLIKIGDKEIDYNPGFKLYITTQLPNPRYSPEVTSKASIVNFAVVEQGLQDQLLGVVVRKEKPDLEQQKNALVMDVAASRKRLVELEDEILQLLSTAQGSLLDNEKLVNALNTSKQTAEAVTEKIKNSEETEVMIDAARNAYRPCAEVASVLYFVLNDMSLIDPMYQFSMDTYTELFEKSIHESSKHEDLAERLSSLNKYHTLATYRVTCRGLFERHKLLFSMQMAVKLMEMKGTYNAQEYDFFLSGGQVLEESQQTKCPLEWIPHDSWENLTQLNKLPAFKGIVESIIQFPEDWQEWYFSTDPEEAIFPGEWQHKILWHQRILLIRSLRIDRVIFAIRNFVQSSLGADFVGFSTLQIDSVLQDSSPTTPLLFVLSAGVDPTNTLKAFAARKGFGEKFVHLSLGQGQSPKATRYLQDGIRQGNWVFLANCHLSISWMSTLEKIIESIASENPHPDFRLWLSSTPHASFPISILQSSIKMTTEPPKGVKANMTRLYEKIESTACTLPPKKMAIFKKLEISLAYFHTLLLERRKFLTLGWNTVYDFNDSDFEICNSLIQRLLEDYETVPWEAMKYLIAEANYGGRVTDDWDRRVIRAYADSLFNDNVLTVSNYQFSPLPNYYIFETSNAKEYLANIPPLDKPELFGQNSNADVASQIREAEELLRNLIMLHPQSTINSGVTMEEKVFSLVKELLQRIPEDLNVAQARKYFSGNSSPLLVVLLQEMTRYNLLLSLIRNSLNDLEKGIKGIVLLTPELEEVYRCINESRVPAAWGLYYPSLKGLGAWIRDLVQRIEFFSEWSKGYRSITSTRSNCILTYIAERSPNNSGWEGLLVLERVVSSQL